MSDAVRDLQVTEIVDDIEATDIASSLLEDAKGQEDL